MESRQQEITGLIILLKKRIESQYSPDPARSRALSRLEECLLWIGQAEALFPPKQNF